MDYCDHCEAFFEELNGIHIIDYGYYDVCDDCFPIVKKMLIHEICKYNVIIEEKNNNNNSFEIATYFETIENNYNENEYNFGMINDDKKVAWAQNLEDLKKMFQIKNVNLWSVSKCFLEFQKMKLKRKKEELKSQKQNLKICELKFFKKRKINMYYF